MTNLSKIESKILSLVKVQDKVKAIQQKGNKVVFTNGCFDILHRGHVTYLAKAADQGDVLVVAVNNDASVKRQGKGSDRPINNEISRALLIASLSFVDYVIVFDEDTPFKLIEFLRPDVLVKGADYDANEKDKNAKKYIVGRDVVIENGGTVKTIELERGYSTTSLVEKIKKG